MKTDMPKQKPGLLRKCFQVIAIVLVCAAGAVITLITELLIGDIQHEAFHEAGVGVRPSELTKLWANETFAAGAGIVSALLLIYLTIRFSCVLAKKFRWK